MPEQFGTHDPTKRYKLEKFEDEYIPHLQVIFLAQVEKISVSKIADITKYAISTVKTYCWKFARAIEKAKRYFAKVDIKAKEEAERRRIEAERRREYEERSRRWDAIHAIEEPKAPEGFCAYVAECYDSALNLIWLKIGKTKSWKRRKTELPNEHKEVCTIIPRLFFPVDEEDDALTMENTLRKFYKNKEGSEYIKTDRFGGITFSKDDLLASPLINQQYQLLGYVMQN